MSSYHELSVIENIRSRPGMYVGRTDERGLHYLLYGLIERGILESPFGQVRGITVTMLDGNFVKLHIEDDGIPAAPTSEEKSRHLEALMTQSQPYGRLIYTTVNALSSELTAISNHNGYAWQQQYQAGVKITEVTQLRPLTMEEANGSIFVFKPDKSIFSDVQFDVDRLTARLREIAYLIAGLLITFSIEQTGIEHQRERFYFPRGLYHMLRDTMPTTDNFSDHHYAPLHAKLVTEPNPAYLPIMLNLTSIEIAIQFRAMPQVQFAYCRMRSTSGGGTHLDALRDGIVYAVNEQAKKVGIHKLPREYILSHVLGVVSVFLPEPRFDHSMNTLLSTEMRNPILQLTKQAIQEFATAQPHQMLTILNMLKHSNHEHNLGRSWRHWRRTSLVKIQGYLLRKR